MPVTLSESWVTVLEAHQVICSAEEHCIRCVITITIVFIISVHLLTLVCCNSKIFLCFRLLMCSCGRYLAPGAPVHYQELLCILFQCIWVCYQGEIQIQYLLIAKDRAQTDEVVKFRIIILNNSPLFLAHCSSRCYAIT